jgi:hypothetical protein
MYADITLDSNNKKLGLIAGLSLFAVMWLLGLLVTGKIMLPGITTPATTDATMTERWGIKVIGIRRTAADYMLDFRYTVLDPQKMTMLMDRKIKPHLIVERTGQKLQVPISAKIGPLRQAAKFAKAGRNYFVFFANPGRTVKKGDRVSIVIGDFTAKHLVVE